MIGFLTSISILCVGAIVLQVDWKNSVNRAFFLLCFLLSTWAELFMLYYYVPNLDLKLFLGRSLLVTFVFIPVTFIYLAKNFPQKSFNLTKLFWVTNLAIIILTLSVAYTKLNIESVFWVDNKLMFEPGWMYFVVTAFYLSPMVLWGIFILIKKAFRLTDKQQKSQLTLLGIGALTSLCVFLTFTVILPYFKYSKLNELASLSPIFLIIFWAVAILKYRLLEAKVILTKTISFVALIILVGTSFYIFLFILNEYAPDFDPKLTLVLIGIFWAVFGDTVREGLITTARHTFVKGYYDSDSIFAEISYQIKDEANRTKVFEKVKKCLDDGMKFDKIWTIVAIRDADGKLTKYLLTDHDNKTLAEISPDDSLIDFFATYTEIKFLQNFAESDKEKLIGYGFDKHSIFIPILSPEMLEGVLILGERGSQTAIVEKDLNFIRIIVNHVTAKLYVLTPQEIVENKYFQHKKKKHDEELQLIRSRQNRSLAHATGQYAHELRTPLNVIRQNTSLLAEGDIQLSEFKEIAMKELDRAQFIVDETLSIAKGKSFDGGVKQLLDVNQTIPRCFKLIPKYHDIELQHKFEKVPQILGDFENLQILFTNLMSNAIEAMSEEGGIISIHSFAQRNEVVVEFSDTGGGISEEQQARIWEPYASGTATSADGGNSTAGKGWGLAIVNRIVNEHDATISMASKVGEGTIFTIRFPIPVD